MQTIKLIQGTPEWHAHRASHFNASDAPAMMGESSYKNRAQLLKEYATGITPEVDAHTQRIFDQGHRFEALARPMAENICDTELYPCVGVEGKLSASFDGIDMLETVCFEHKTLNKTLKACANVDELPAQYKIQMEQQLMVSGAVKCLFIASKWDDEDNLIDSVKFWYESNPNLAQRIADGWVQFEKDLADYVHVEVVEPAKAFEIELPAVEVQARGELVVSNVASITPMFEAFLSNAITVFNTDDDFATAQAQAKVARAAAKQCAAVSEQVIAQMASIGEVTRLMKHYAERFNALALSQEKGVERQKEAKKAEAMAARVADYNAHIDSINAEFNGVRLVLSQDEKPNFLQAMKNQRTLESLYNKLDSELARAKIAADSAARIVRANLKTLDEYSDFRFLFNDLQSLVTKSHDDFSNVVKMRVFEHGKAEQARIEAEREKIRAEEQAKAAREAQAKLSEQQAQETQAEPLQEPLQTIAPESTANETSKSEHTGEATLTLGLINERLGFIVHAGFLAQLGFEPEQVGKFKKYHEHQFKPMCAAIIAHLSSIK
jgi:putative phage-type endonuclease